MYGAIASLCSPRAGILELRRRTGTSENTPEEQSPAGRLGPLVARGAFPPRKGNVDLAPWQLMQGVKMTFSPLLREGTSLPPCSVLPQTQPFKLCSLAQSAVPLRFVKS